MKPGSKTMLTTLEAKEKFIVAILVFMLALVAGPSANANDSRAISYTAATEKVRNRLKLIAEQYNTTCTKQGRFYEAQNLSMQDTVKKELRSLNTPPQLAEVCIWADSQPSRAVGEGHYFSEVMDTIHVSCVHAISKYPKKTALPALNFIRKHASMDGSHGEQMDEVLFNFQVRSRPPFVYLFMQPSNAQTQRYEREVHQAISPGWESLYSKFADQTKPIRCNVTFSIQPDSHISTSSVSIEGGSDSDRPIIESWLKALKVPLPPAGMKFTRCDFLAEF